MPYTPTVFINGSAPAINATELNKIGNGIAEINSSPAATTLNPVFGSQIVTATSDSPFNVLNICGRTLSNLYGKSGDFESTAKYSPSNATGAIDATRFTTGLNSVKYTKTSTTSTVSFANNASNVYPVSGDCYIMIVDAYFESATSVAQHSFNSSGTTINQKSVTSTTTGYATTTTGSFIPIIAAGNVTAVTTVGVSFFLTLFSQTGASTTKFNLDSYRCYKISTAEYTALGTGVTLAQAQALALYYPYVDDVKHVNGTYINRLSENLAPTVDQWSGTLTHMTATDPYSVQFTGTTIADEGIYFDFPSLAGAQYTITGLLNITAGTFNSLGFRISGVDANGAIIGGSGASGGSSGLIAGSGIMPTGTVKARISITAGNNTGMTFSIKNIRVNIGGFGTDKGSRAQNADYLYFPNTALASNFDNSVFDQIYRQDGKWFRQNQFIRDMVLDGSLSWSFSSDWVGYKQLKLPLTGYVNYIGTLVKYDGTIATNKGTDGSVSSGDQFQLWSDNNLYLTVSDTNSGWGDSYNGMGPTELQAYFNGWKLFVSGGPYTDAATFPSGTKAWGRKLTNGTWGDIRTTLPTDSAFSFSDSMYKTPYKITYQLAAPTFEEIAAEGSISLLEGSNQIEVGNGVIVREKVFPVTVGAPLYYINAVNIGGGRLKFRSARLLAVYKNGLIDKTWSFATNTISNEFYMYAQSSNYDPTATYEVTYIALDQYALTTNVQVINGEYNSNIKTVVDTLVQNGADLETRLSVVENNKARKVQGNWIAPTLLSSWVNYGFSQSIASYYKDDFGIVRLRGLIKNGTTAAQTLLFTLPIGYRPANNILIQCVANNGTTDVLFHLAITSGGNVLIDTVAAANTWLNLDGISFLAEQ